MTNQELHAALDLSNKIQRLTDRLNDIRQSLGKAPEVRVQGGQGVSTAQIAADLSEEVSELEEQFKIEQVVIQRYIDKCSLDDTERKLMTLRYVKCYPWKDIETALCYSRSHTYQMHINALENIGLERTSSDL